jgi:hypothetical protein
MDLLKVTSLLPELAVIDTIHTFVDLGLMKSLLIVKIYLAKHIYLSISRGENNFWPVANLT